MLSSPSSYIFHACSTFALDNIKKGKGKHKHICFFYFIYFIPRGRTIAWYSERCVTSASCCRVGPLLATDSLGNAAGEFSRVRFGSGPGRRLVPTPVFSDVHRRMKTLSGDWYSALTWEALMHAAHADCGNWVLILLRTPFNASLLPALLHVALLGVSWIMYCTFRCIFRADGYFKIPWTLYACMRGM